MAQLNTIKDLWVGFGVYAYGMVCMHMGVVCMHMGVVCMHMGVVCMHMGVVCMHMRHGRCVYAYGIRSCVSVHMTVATGKLKASCCCGAALVVPGHLTNLGSTA